jgi:hypothetical protein
VQELAALRGLSDSFVLIENVPDEILRLLYQEAALLVLPSYAEGFGLPILEAMRSGAPVIAGNNSAQIEVLGDAGFLVNPGDPAEIAEKIEQVLQNPELANELRKRSLIQARNFSWERTIGRTLEIFEEVAARKVQRRIALFAPFPPKTGTGAEYALYLVKKLKRNYTVDVYHDVGYLPQLFFAAPELGCFDYRLFDRYAKIFAYEEIVFVTGDGPEHRFVRETCDRHRGIIVSPDDKLEREPYWGGIFA